LLHSPEAANASYNKIANRANESDFSFEHDHEPAPAVTSPTKELMPVSKPVTRSKDRRERIFHGDFTPSGSDKKIEIEIFET
jgi:hypothetical protein